MRSRVVESILTSCSVIDRLLKVNECLPPFCAKHNCKTAGQRERAHDRGPLVIEHLIEDLAKSLGQWAYLLVGGMAMAETAAFLGFIAPGEFAVIFGGVRASLRISADSTVTSISPVTR